MERNVMIQPSRKPVVENIASKINEGHSIIEGSKNRRLRLAKIHAVVASSHCSERVELAAPNPKARHDARPTTAHRVLWSPTIRAAVIAGTPWLDVYCPGCGTSRAPPAGVCGHAGARTGPKSPVCCCVDTCFMDDNHLISLHSLAASAARASRSRSAAVTMMQSRRVFSPILSVGFLTPLL